MQGIRSISERYKLIVEWLKELPYILCFHFKHNYHKTAYQKSWIGLFIIFITCIMKNSKIFVLWIWEQTYKFSNKFMNHRQIQRPKIIVKGIIHQFLVYREKVCINIWSWRSRTWNPVKSIFNNFNISPIIWDILSCLWIWTGIS